jgi:DedD protein
MMDRRVKERLIGATILVVLIVLIVPELLSGPKRLPAPLVSASEPVLTRHVTVDLATSKATPAPTQNAASAAAVDPPSVAKTKTARPSADDTTADDGGGAAGAPTPDLTPPAAAAPGTATPGVTAPAVKPGPALETAPSSPKSSLAWAVQLGSFANKANADKLVRQLKAGGASIYVISSGSGASLRYRVRMGPLADRDAAERALIKLRASGYPATIVTPTS